MRYCPNYALRALWKGTTVVRFFTIVSFNSGTQNSDQQKELWTEVISGYSSDADMRWSPEQIRELHIDLRSSVMYAANTSLIQAICWYRNVFTPGRSLSRGKFVNQRSGHQIIRKHERIRCGERPYKSEVCGASFKRLSTYRLYPMVFPRSQSWGIVPTMRGESFEKEEYTAELDW